jgi:hypothetical protein
MLENVFPNKNSCLLSANDLSITITYLNRFLIDFY